MSLTQSGRHDARDVFVQHLDLIERIIAAVCRRHGVHGDDADEFASSVRLKLVENEYAVLRNFRGESSIATYLTVVIAMLFREYRVQHWGRWRPSAEARRHGELGVRLETLVYRDGLSLYQAAESLRSAGHTDRSNRELAALLEKLPARTSLRPVVSGPEALARSPASASAEDLVVVGETEAEGRAVNEALSQALAKLPAEDRLIVRMRFLEGMSVADIARGLALPQKPLYRRIERVLVELRKSLEKAGVSREHIRTLIECAAR